ncbi:MAG: carboxypeptidase regulatory-like domain-containing protein, partial [Spirochaetales bacterium]|nr:carboxypeptidase regulatory-like domain-containing protein [Candidatus Physcosoma equi]
LELTENEAGALITASSLETPSWVYTAISNSRGSFTLAGVRPGQYTVTISAANYSSVTLETISILEGSTMDIGKTELPIARGFITGVAILEGRASSAGIKAELMKGSDVYDTVYTDASGAYVFSVPQGNYSGVRLSAEDFRSESRAQSIALIANDYVAIEGRTLTMIATHVPEVKGRVTVTGLLSQDYSGTTISLEELPEFTVETDEDGYWSFSKVPVGNYTLRMERENTRLVTVKFSLTAAASRTIETIALEPNAASIEGHVTLTGLSDYSGITVRATAEGAVELRTTTNAAGYFYIGNVITTKEYTAHFEKNGWNSVERRVSGLENLSLNDITSSNPISLTDTTVPVINSMTVIAGNSEVEGRRLNVYLNVEEAGSGCRRVYVNTTDDFAGVEPIAYASPFSCFVEDTAGDYTLYVKVEDTSGNLSSVYSSPFKVSDYRTVVSGVLVDNEDGINDGVITWTKAKSPYYVTSNILVEEGKTLIVEPGVNIQFSGNYYMQVDGTLLVNGTESENVYFYGVGSGWSGIGMSSDESVIQYAQISNLNRGIGGKGCLYHCIIQGGSVLGENSSMGAFQGRVYNSSFQGTIYAQSNYFGNCEIEGYASFYGTVVSGCRFHSGAYIDGIAENCEFFNQSVTICDEAMYCSFSNCFVLSGYRENQAKLLGNNFYSCTFSDVDFGIVRGCNFFNLAKLSTKCEKTRVASMDFTGNYWGPDYTAELNTYGTGSNLSFIHDYYDDFALAKFDLSGYATEAFADAGHKGDSYYSSEESTVQYQIGDRGPAGGWVFYDKGFYSEGWRYLEAAPTDLGSYKFCYYQRNDNAPREAIYTMQTVGSGRMNTNLLSMLMLDHAYSESDSNAKSNDFAARMCFDYEVNGYDDWFLPSKDELNLMYINLKANGIGSFENFNYWSSSMSDYYGNIWTQYFGNGSLCVSTGAVIQNKVRAVRAF